MNRILGRRALTFLIYPPPCFTLICRFSRALGYVNGGYANLPIYHLSLVLSDVFVYLSTLSIHDRSRSRVKHPFLFPFFFSHVNVYLVFYPPSLIM